MSPRIAFLLACAASVACRGEPPATAQSVSDQQLAALVDSLMPMVAKASGLSFKSTPKSAVRSREQIRGYLLAKLAQDMPPARLEGVSAAYRLLGMIPDSLDISKLFVDLYTEQVAGFYDPDSLTLFALDGTDRTQLRLVLAHELVHALQHQYTPLDSILHDLHDADRFAAAQAVLEGQATLASMAVLVPGTDVLTDDGFWETFRVQLHQQQQTMPVFASAPTAIRQDLVFPYLHGSDFVRWFRRNRSSDQPLGSALPVSTEQILHPERYAAGDAPLTVRFSDDTSDRIHDDTFGEFEIAVLRSSAAGIDEVPTDTPAGWAGDRLRVYRSPDGPALVWVTVWDEPRYADRFRTQVASLLQRKPRAGYRVAVDPQQLDGHGAVRIVIAPDRWARWAALPAAAVSARH